MFRTVDLEHTDANPNNSKLSEVGQNDRSFEISKMPSVSVTDASFGHNVSALRWPTPDYLSSNQTKASSVGRRNVLRAFAERHCAVEILPSTFRQTQFHLGACNLSKTKAKTLSRRQSHKDDEQ
ncbi:hypothetical protein [Roseimaritima ulvae]|uniref:hypothetical protein n=1 Tax=Roseimaritima ulvae TaxID=980254 RepID=UPI0012FA758A|nr:hypothetical protein [Roseimaritima ulvae]